MAGQQLAKLGRNNDAITVYQRGIEEANRQGNNHAANEMQAFLAMLLQT